MRSHCLPMLRTAAFTLACLSLQPLHAAEGYTAKGLFSTPDGTTGIITTPGGVPAAPRVATAPKNLGTSYVIRLVNPDGSTTEVSPARVFRSGEKFQIGVTVNRPAYVYVFNLSPDQRLSLLYPQSKDAQNLVSAGRTVLVPGNDTFVFDGSPGVEELGILASTRPISQPYTQYQALAPDYILQTSFDAIPSTGTARNCGSGQTTLAMASASPDYQSKAIVMARNDTGGGCNAGAQAVAADQSALNYASKGIYVTGTQEVSATPVSDPRIYVVKELRNQDVVMSVKVKLVHQ